MAMIPTIVPPESYRGEVLGVGLTIEEAHHLLEVLAAYVVSDIRRPPAELFARASCASGSARGCALATGAATWRVRT